MSLPPVGSQLIVFGPKYNINTDTDAILDCLARAGYAGVEGGSNDPVDYRARLEARGMRYGASHTGLANLLDVKPIIAYLKAVGGADLCNSALMSWDGRSLADYRDGITILNRAGRQLRAEGIHLHYHNHAFEFELVDGGKTGMELLLDGLDPEVVDLCVDVAWVYRGGENPAEYLRAHKDRVGSLHFKDFDGDNWIELGNGKVPFAEIMTVLPELTGVRWVMIEQDSSQIDPMDSVAISRTNLRERFGY